MADSVYLYERNRITVAQIAGASGEFGSQAGRVLSAAKRVAAESAVTGAYLRALSMKTVPGESGSGVTVRDRLIVADDPGAGPIEWGHLIRYKNSRRVRWVPGKHIMTRALASVR